jgi:hypothetical protein
MTFILPKPLKGIPRPYVLVCEGTGDAGFLEALLEHLKIDNCCIGCPSPETAGGQGVDKIPAYLKGIAVEATRASSRIDGIAVIVDANGDPGKRFQDASVALRNAMFPSPADAFTVVPGPPRSGVFVIPGKGKNGTLDDLLLEATFKKSPMLRECVDKFSDCTKTLAATTDNQKAKMRLSALAGIYCKDNPWTSPRLLWKSTCNPVPIDSDSFAELTAFLTTLTTQSLTLANP